MCVKISNFYYKFVYYPFSFFNFRFTYFLTVLLGVYKLSVVRYYCWSHTFLIMKCPFLSLEILPALKFAVWYWYSYTCLTLSICIIYLSSSFQPFVSLYLKCVSYKQHIVGFCFLSRLTLAFQLYCLLCLYKPNLNTSERNETIQYMFSNHSEIKLEVSKKDN